MGVEIIHTEDFFFISFLVSFFLFQFTLSVFTFASQFQLSYKHHKGSLKSSNYSMSLEYLFFFFFSLWFYCYFLFSSHQLFFTSVSTFTLLHLNYHNYNSLPSFYIPLSSIITCSIALYSPIIFLYSLSVSIPPFNVSLIFPSFLPSLTLSFLHVSPSSIITCFFASVHQRHDFKSVLRACGERVTTSTTTREEEEVGGNRRGQAEGGGGQQRKSKILQGFNSPRIHLVFVLYFDCCSRP